MPQFDIKVSINGKTETDVEPEASLAAAKKHAQAAASAMTEATGLEVKVLSVTPHKGE